MIRLGSGLFKSKGNNLRKSFESASCRAVWRNTKRCVTTQSSKSDNLFPGIVDFPSRHIGPRDQDIVTMLDSLGYKVCIGGKSDFKFEVPILRAL